MKKTNRKPRRSPRFSHRGLVAGFLLTCCLLGTTFAQTPEEIINRLNENFSKIRYAQANINLDTSLQLLGCGGLQRRTGTLYYKAPDKLRIKLDYDTYYIQGNNIRKIDGQGNRFYVKLLSAPDFSPGFNPKVISHNFLLKVLKETDEEIVLEGTPKPGILKNVNRVTFIIDPKEYVLRKMALSLKQGISGKIDISYGLIKGCEVPTATFGKSALEIYSGALVGLIFDLKGNFVSVNHYLPDDIFNPGF